MVYFSATGNTEAVVQDIVDETGATSFAIQPAQPYTSEDLDYNDPDSRVSKEHADPSLQDVALAQDTPDDWASYDTVLIGYPIWWGEAAYPLASFARANDFTRARPSSRFARRRHLAWGRAQSISLSSRTVESGWAACAFPRA